MRTTAVAVLGGCILASGMVYADAITINGQRVDNVLVTKTSSFYYVQFPREGRTLNIPVDDVDAGSVQINDDPFYRDKLKAEYKENLALREEGREFEVDPAFRVAPGEGGSAEFTPGAGGGGGGGGGAGLGVPRTAVEGQLAAMGLQFQPGPGRNGQPSVVAQMPDGSRVELVGPPDQLYGIAASGSGAPAQVKMMMTQLNVLVMNLQPAAAGAVQELVAEAEQNGSSRKSVGGVTLSLTQSQQSDTAVSIEFQMMAGG